MAVSISFPSTTRNLALPLLFSGQAQKEFSLNQAFVIVDAVLQGGVKASLVAPPSQPEEGDCFRVLSPASGDWVGRDDSLAIQIGGGWHFVEPTEGMRVFDLTAGQSVHYNAGWSTANAPVAPSGGNTVDIEARTAIAELVESLRSIGVFPN